MLNPIADASFPDAVVPQPVAKAFAPVAIVCCPIATAPSLEAFGGLCGEPPSEPHAISLAHAALSPVDASGSPADAVPTTAAAHRTSAWRIAEASFMAAVARCAIAEMRSVSSEFEPAAKVCFARSCS